MRKGNRQTENIAPERERERQQTCVMLCTPIEGKRERKRQTDRQKWRRRERVTANMFHFTYK